MKLDEDGWTRTNGTGKLLWLLSGGHLVAERGWFWVVRSAGQLAVLVSFVAVLPWLDARWVAYLEEPDEPAEPVQT